MTHGLPDLPAVAATAGLGAPGSVRPPLWLVLLTPFALATIASSYVPLKLRGLVLVFSAGVGLACMLLWSSRRSQPPSPPSGWSLISWLLILVLAFEPVGHMAVAPGADQAMYSAIAHNMASARPGLSPAYGDVAPLVYPRGYSLLLAAVALLSGPPKASLIGAGVALVLFAMAPGEFLHALGLGRYSPVYAISLALMCRVPQEYFAWGGNSTTLAFAYGLAASASFVTACDAPPSASIHVVLATLFALAAMATHPIGALGGLCLGAVAAELRHHHARLGVFVPPLAAIALFAPAAHHYGPHLSGSETRWIRAWVRSPGEAVFLRVRTPWGGITARLVAFAARWRDSGIFHEHASFVRAVSAGPDTLLFFLRAARNAAAGLQASLGSPFFALAAFGITAGLVLRQWRPLGLLSLAAALVFAGLELVGPRLPLVGILAYPARWLPALAVVLSIPAWSIHRALPRRSGQATLGLLLLGGVGCNYLWFRGQFHWPPTMI